MNYCESCAIRLYNTKHHNLQGIGNPWNGNCIVIPNVDYDAYKFGDISFSKQVKLIKDILIPSTGVNDSNLFIIPLIRCNEYISCKLDTESYKKCLHYFANDINKYDFKHILLLGNAGRRFLNIDISSHLNDIFISKNNRYYYVNYSPFIYYMDNDKYNIFKTNLEKWYNAINFNKFDNYNIIKL